MGRGGQNALMSVEVRGRQRLGGLLARLSEPRQCRVAAASRPGLLRRLRDAQSSDRHAVVLRPDLDYVMVAVFAGHGPHGSQVAELAARILSEVLERRLLADAARVAEAAERGRRASLQSRDKAMAEEETGTERDTSAMSSPRAASDSPPPAAASSVTHRVSDISALRKITSSLSGGARRASCAVSGGGGGGAEWTTSSSSEEGGSSTSLSDRESSGLRRKHRTVAARPPPPTLDPDDPFYVPTELAMQDAFVDASIAVDATPWARHSGTTASVAVLRGGRLVVGSMGDCALVVGRRRGGVVALRRISDTHTVGTSAPEKERVERFGGVIQNGGFVADEYERRAMAVTRSLGDTEMRKSGVCQLPQIGSMPVTHRDTIVALSTVPLWDDGDPVAPPKLTEVVNGSLGDGPLEISHKLLDVAFGPTGPASDATLVCVQLTR